MSIINFNNGTFFTPQECFVRHILQRLRIYDTRYVSIVRHYDRAEFFEFLTPELKSRRTNKKSYRGGRMARSGRGEPPRSHMHAHARARMCGTHARSGDGRYNDGRGVPYSV